MASPRVLLLLIVMAVLGTAALVACSGVATPAGSLPTTAPLATLPPAPGVPTQPGGAQPTRIVPTPRPAPTGSPGPTGELVITAQVREVDASARVITLVEPVHGLEAVAITDKTQIQSIDGSPRTLQDVKPGVVIQAAGTAGGSNSVLATTIRILTAPSPIPQS